MEFYIEFHKIWQERCEATRAILERFGGKSALDYIVGEKLLNFAMEADRSPESAAGLLYFQAAVWDVQLLTCSEPLAARKKPQHRCRSQKTFIHADLAPLGCCRSQSRRPRKSELTLSSSLTRS